jgi:hypothetical protein
VAFPLLSLSAAPGPKFGFAVPRMPWADGSPFDMCRPVISLSLSFLPNPPNDERELATNLASEI